MRRDQQFDMSPEPFETNMGYNPEFLKRVRERQRREARERRIEQAEQEWREKQERIARRDEEAKTRVRNEEAVKSYRVMVLKDGGGEKRVKDIIATVADRHGVFPGEITGASRNRKVVRTRYEAIAAVKALKPHLSLVQIGKFFNRDHATIIYALRKMGVA